MVLLPNALDSGSQGAVEEVELEEVDSEEITEEGDEEESLMMVLVGTTIPFRSRPTILDWS